MVSVILNWIYICITAFVTGYGVLRFLTRHLSCAKKQMPDRPDAYVMCGLVCVTVYAQFFSLFAGVGLAANLLLCAACIAIVLREREGLMRTLADFLRPEDCGAETSKSVRRLFGVKCCAAAALFLLFAYGTSRGMIHYDTGLYHAQSIRWIEEYGAVKGLGNLHCRLAYNSASFALSALYSMAFLGKGSFHCVAGFLAFLLAAGCLRLIDSLREKRLRASDFARVMCVYYLVNLFDEMISPASDYFMVLIAFYLVITWLSLAERGEKEIFPYALLCVLAVFLLTVKLSAALVLLLTIYPACRLIKEKRFKETACYLGLGLVVTIPFFIRNVVLSGWLVYPFTRIDLFDVAWKIPKGLADYDAREIQVYGRGYTDVAQFDLPMRKWLPGWFRALAGSDQVFVLAAVFAVAALAVFAAYLLRRRATDGRMQQSAADVSESAAHGGVALPALLTAQGTVAACFLFWLCTSPLMRYGCVWVYLTPAVVFGGIYDALLHGGAAWRRWTARVVSAAVILLLAYKGFALLRTVVSAESGYLLLQKEYENYETVPYEIEGVTFYYPAEGDRVGYDSFPSSPVEAKVSFLGEGLADGFYLRP